MVRVYVVTLCVVAIAAMIFAKAFKLAALEPEHWKQMSQKQYVGYRDVLGERGNILSEDGSLLATSIPYFDVYWDATIKNNKLTDEYFKNNIDSLSLYLATYIAPQYTPGMWKDFLWQHRFIHKSRYVLIAKKLTYDQAEWLKTFPIFKLGRYSGGLIVNRINQREHPFRMLALRTLGYVREGAKPVGLEGYFDKTLTGGAHKVLMQRIGNEVYAPVNDLSDIEPKNGDDLVTTIDVNIQDITQSALLRACDVYEAEHACAIVMEVATGKIKGIANVGRGTDGWWEDYNYAIGQSIEPGSTWKIASMLSLLEDGNIRLSDTVDIENGITKYFNETLEDHERTNKRLVSVKEAFSRSSNVGISKLIFNAYKERPQAYIKHLKDFNLAIPTGVEIDGEAPPKIKNADDATWSGITLPWMSIGYELEVTPLQLLTFVNAIANNGAMMKPYLVNEVQRYGELVKQYRPIIVKKKIATQNSLDQIRELMESVVEMPGGTAYHLRTPQYRFAGKTGTAQLNYSKDKGKTHRGGYQGSFVGYFPAENPVFSCIVVMSKPKRGYYGGICAAPVFREIADKLMASNVKLSQTVNLKGKPVASALTLPDDAGNKTDLLKTLQNMSLKHEIVSKPDDEWTFTRARNDTVFVVSRNIGDKKRIPSVVGMGLKDALFLLENRGLRVRFSGYGKVITQSLTPGNEVTRGQEISIRLD